jgi:hypothetical protein
MTQYRIDTHEFWGANKTIYEVNLTTDMYGSTNGGDILASMDWEEVSR